MVLDARADAAAIDSNTFQFFLEEHPELKPDLHVLHSIGPLPIPPIVINSRMPGRALGLVFFSPPQWAHMHRFLSVCLKKFRLVNMSI